VWLLANQLIKIGTSGYSYPWNEGKPTPFRWYLSQGLDTVEINGTFYRFPTQPSINTWREAPSGFDFSIKVNQTITHRFRLGGEGALEYFERFTKLFDPMRDRVTFWLFQMPPSFRASDENLAVVEEFFMHAAQRGLANKAQAVVEFREKGWWKSDFRKRMEDAGLVFCSVDSPELPRDIITMNGSLYLRLHGRKSWYSDIYEEEELDKICEQVQDSPAPRKYIYLNNDHGMLPNAFYLKEKLGRRRKRKNS